MPEAAIAPVAQEPTKIPPPVSAGSQGSAALAEGDKAAQQADNPFEFEVDVKGQKQKLSFKTKDQLTAVLQKALYADQVIKDATQAKKGAETLMQKLKTEEGVREVLSDPDINLDVKKFALKIVQEMMDDEALTPEQKEYRELKKYRDQTESEKKTRAEQEAQQKKQAELQKNAQIARTAIIESMKKYPDIPQTQATMDACILNMRAAYRRFGKHLTPDQAMAVYSEQYWKSFSSTIEKMTPEQIMGRFGQKTFDRIQQMKLNQLKNKTNPANVKSAGDGQLKKKKYLTEKEFDQHFKELAGGL